jgi:S1-C subfamily serine protease
MKLENNILNACVKIFSSIQEFNYEIPYIPIKQSQITGSGFFIDLNGHVLTAAHVVENAISVQISLPKYGKQKFKTDIISIYPDNDMALLKVRQSKNLVQIKNKSFMELGNSNKVYFGDKTYALGFPEDADSPIVTAGVVSGVRDDYIQTDAPINHGNSGGPLLNHKKKVVGINVAILEEADNVGLLIPINVFKNIKDNMLVQKIPMIFRPVLGISLRNIVVEENKYVDKGECIGSIIKSIHKKSNLYKKVGVRKNDIICSLKNLSINNFGEYHNKQINSKQKFTTLIKQFNPNKTISIEVFRPSTNTVIKGKCYLNTDKELYPIRKYFPPNDIPDYEIFGGFIVMNLTMHHILLKKLHILRYLSYQERLDKGRVIVTHIFPSASIHNYNVLSEIEFITEINEKKISTVQQFRKYILDKSLYKKKKNIETGKIDLLLKIKTYCNTDFEQPIKTVVEETFHLSKIYKYPISPFHIKLKKRFLQKV